MSLPAELAQIPVVQRTYVYRDGTPVANKKITLELATEISVGLSTIVPKRLTIRLDENGQVPADTTLPSTNDPDASIVGLAYTVTEHWTDGRSGLLVVPHDADQVDLADLVDSVPPVSELDEVTQQVALALGYKTAAASSATAAAASETGAGVAQAAAEAAQAAAEVAQGSAENAAANATSGASTATTKAGEAASSAAAAAASEAAASASATAAAASESAAASSASTASTAASTATTKAAEAATSAQAAGDSADAAAASAAALVMEYGVVLHNDDGLVDGGFPAARSVPKALTATTFYAEIIEGISANVSVLINDVLVYGPISVSGVVSNTVSIALAAGDGVTFDIEFDSVTKLWAQISGVAS